MSDLHRYDCFDMFDDFEQAAKAVALQQERCLAPLGLTKAQFNVLREIALVRLPRTYTDLAGDLRCDQTTVSDAVKILIRKGLVEATRDHKDRRRGAVKATSEGRKAFAAAVEARKALEDDLWSAIGAEESDSFGSACARLKEAYGKD